MNETKTIQLSYGRAKVPLRVPASATVLLSPGSTPHPHPAEAVRAALRHPIGSPPLRDVVGTPRTVAVTISDGTRAVPNDVFLPVLLDELAAAGVPDSRIVIIVGTGMHRPSSDAEKTALVGAGVRRRVEVIDHRADDASQLVDIEGDLPVRINRRFAEADVRIVTGFIEPHFMAGYSGGRKGVCPALVDLETIQTFHGYRTLSSPDARAGVLDGNPCHDIALKVARRVGVDFLLNVTTSTDHRIAEVFCGDLEQAHNAGCLAVDRAAAVRIRESFDLVITTGGGAPLDQNFYQTVKGIVMAAPAVHRPGGVLAVLSHCTDGLGSDEYADIVLRYGRDCGRYLSDLAGRPDRTEKDQWEHQLHCRVAEELGIGNIWLATDGLAPDVQRSMALSPILGDGTPADRLQRAVDRYIDRHPEARIAVIPRGPYTMIER